MSFIRHLRKIAKNYYYLRYVCPSVRVELASHRTNFHEM
jgi:hypothetical protein